MSTAAAAAADVASPAGLAPAVVLRDVRFAYRVGADVLHVPSLAIARGERVFVYGPSGSGKTTLLGLLAGVLRATGGSVQVLGRELTRLSGAERDAFRAEHVGYVFQMFNLIPYLSVRENVTLPARLDAARRARLGGETPDAAARRLAEHLGIVELLDEPVTALSVGQQQRVAAARAARRAGAGDRRRADVGAGRGPAQALPRAALPRVRGCPHDAGVREPRPAARADVRPGGVAAGVEPRGPGTGDQGSGRGGPPPNDMMPRRRSIHRILPLHG